MPDETKPTPTPASKPAPRHKATFARDNLNPGKWNIRVEGPDCTKFEGREVPVTKLDGSQQVEKLGKPFWSGVSDNGAPCCLYKFEQKPKAPPEDVQF